MKKYFNILGIETSCDETAAALLQIPNSKFQDTKKTQISNLKFQILSNVVLSQVEIHKKYGGIVPEVAARQHVQAIIPVIEEVLDSRNKIQDTPRQAQGLSARYKKDTNSKPQISKPDLIAVTHGPGLITSLQIGLQTAKTLAYIWNVPLIGINHLEAHLWSYLLNQDTRPPRYAKRCGQARYTIQDTRFPAIGLIVSGGHTEMVLVKGIGKYKLIGRTRDDAVGEAFDKVAKLLNIGYPGGPIISHYAKKGNAKKIDFPRPMIDSDDFDFSFSGIKTAVKYFLKEKISTGTLSQQMINDICASFQTAVIEVLVTKTIKAAREFKAKSIILGGGVSANESLIENLKLKTENLNIEFYYPAKEFTQDNAAMVALIGYLNNKKASRNNWKKLTAEANLKLV